MTEFFTLASGEDYAGKFGRVTDIIEGLFVADTSILADGDVVTNTLALAGAYRVPYGRMLLKSLLVIDEDDNTATAMDVVFFSANVSLGTKNSAPAMSDTDARSVIGHVNIATTDFVDYGGAKAGCKKAIDLMLEDTGGDQALYVSIITRGGTPTYTASGLRIRLGVEKY